MENRQRITLYEQMMTSSSNTGNTRSSLATLIQNDAVLAIQKTRNQTLLDIIRENEPNNVVDNSNNTKDRKSWKAFKELLRIKRRNADESTHQEQQRNGVVREDLNNSDPVELLAGGESSDEEINVNNSEAVQVSMSLMDLLEESEIDLDQNGDVYESDDVDEKREEEEDREGEGGVSVERNCCVCMVRHKGAAFIPCGHTFCRMCSRELWVNRGNCPLCNNLILEVLDIF